MSLQPDFAVLRNPDGSIDIQAYARRAVWRRRAAKRRTTQGIVNAIQNMSSRMAETSRAIWMSVKRHAPTRPI